MLKSMTGYGRAEAEGVRYRVTVETRSLNSRYLDVHLRLPTGGWGLEPMVRKRIQKRFKRGRIEVQIQLEALHPDVELPVEPQVGKARAYVKALETLQSALGIPGEVDLALLATFRDALWSGEVPLEKERLALEEGLRAALNSLEKMREKEGQSLQEDLEKRLQWIHEELQRIKAAASETVKSYRKRWKERLDSLKHADQTLDPTRLEQEMVIWAERTDVTEELVRLESHINQYRHLLEENRAVGRRMEFLLQEMHREVNTLGTKAMDAAISQRMVEMKAQIERMREQAQNVE